MEIFGVSFFSISRKEVKERVAKAFREKTNLRIVTLNPEYLLLARTNRRFQASLKQADLTLIDGFGITLVGWLCGIRLDRFTGADLLEELFAEAERRQIPAVVLLSPQGLSSQTEVGEMLGRRWPNLRYQFHPSEQFACVVCTFGAPSQEFVLNEYPAPAITVGVGGAVDYLTGKQKRAPFFLRTLGLEWLWRLTHQPTRLKRIGNAVLVFPILALSDTIKKKWLK